MTKYSVYLLVKDKKPIYVGCSVNVKNRISHHRKTKEFDNYYILKEYKNKKEALVAENSIIRFISVFGGDEWVNGKHFSIMYEGFHYGFNNSFK
jgi:hypothetical protein